MTHLLASLLTGLNSTLPTGSTTQGPTNRGCESGPGFEKLLQGHATENRNPQEDAAQGTRHENEPATGKKQPTESQVGPQAEQVEGDQAGLRQDAPVNVTLLGATLGARTRAPALTFMLPAGAGPEGMAAAIRTQVLRFTAARNLDPGSLDNLRIAISSRELGQVEVDLSARGDKLEVDIVAAGREAESVLRKTSGELKEGLLARTDRFRQVEVKVATRHAQDEESPDRQTRQEPDHNKDQRARHGAEEPQDPDHDPTEDRS